MHTYIVKLNNINLKAIHGLHKTEKKNKQLFEVDIEACLIDKKTCNDNIKNSINYEKIYKILLDVFSNNTFNLLETLGEKIIQKICRDNNVKSVKVTIRKPEIQFDNNSSCVEVSIMRNNA